jgi:hypothetical protein
LPLPAKNTGDIYFFTYAIVVAKFNFTFELAPSVVNQLGFAPYLAGSYGLWLVF